MIPRIPTPVPEDAFSIELVDIELGLANRPTSPQITAAAGFTPINTETASVATPMPRAHLTAPTATQRPVCSPFPAAASTATIATAPPPLRIRDIRGRNVDVLPSYANTVAATRGIEGTDDIKRWKMLFLGAMAALVVFVIFVVWIYMGPGQAGANGPVEGEPGQTEQSARPSRPASL
ncbi:hypothetical protein BZA77DRAFT_295217 [Pyronema omphalodes]|nr:hypothetical protein BZA77DRAFT_295706 [Pyronema omphalodes]KAI5814358.1 hypothetical protein BZA77DRAFT_295217 [Pyronema omphalodes]